MWGVTLRTNVYSNLIKHEYQANTYFPLTSFLAESEQFCKRDFGLPFHIFTFIFSSRNSDAILMCFPTLSCSPREDSPQDRLPTRPMMFVSWTLINVFEGPVTPTRWYHGPSVSWAIGLIYTRSRGTGVSSAVWMLSSHVVYGTLFVSRETCTSSRRKNETYFHYTL